MIMICHFSVLQYDRRIYYRLDTDPQGRIQEFSKVCVCGGGGGCPCKILSRALRAQGFHIFLNIIFALHVLYIHAHRLSVTSYVLSALHVLSPIFFQIFAKCKFSYLVICHRRSGQDSGVIFICLLQPATCKPNRTISINVDYLLYISYLLIIFPFGKRKGTSSYLVHVH